MRVARSSRVRIGRRWRARPIVGRRAPDRAHRVVHDPQQRGHRSRPDDQHLGPDLATQGYTEHEFRLSGVASSYAPDRSARCRRTLERPAGRHRELHDPPLRPTAGRPGEVQRHGDRRVAQRERRLRYRGHVPPGPRRAVPRGLRLRRGQRAEAGRRRAPANARPLRRRSTTRATRTPTTSSPRPPGGARRQAAVVRSSGSPKTVHRRRRVTVSGADGHVHQCGQSAGPRLRRLLRLLPARRSSPAERHGARCLRPRSSATDGPEPILDLQTEGDLVVLRSHTAHQPDSKRFRLWEVAGGSHADEHTLSRTSPPAADDARLALHRAAQLEPHLPGAGGGDPRAPALGQGRCAAPAHAPRLEIGDPNAADPVVRDQFGLAKGGIRLPQIDVPTALVDGIANPPTPGSPELFQAFCRLFGRTRPFTAAQLAALYPNHKSYVDPFVDGDRQAPPQGLHPRSRCPAVEAGGPQQHHRPLIRTRSHFGAERRLS